jgi:tetratricopeptide (TPR) repeat protein
VRSRRLNFVRRERVVPSLALGGYRDDDEHRFVDRLTRPAATAKLARSPSFVTDDLMTSPTEPISESPITETPIAEPLAGTRIAIVGPLASMSRREAQQLIRQRGGLVVDQPDATAQWIIVGEDALPLDNNEELFDASLQQSIERGDVTLLSETQFWQRLGLVESQQHVHRLYTPAMLAEMLGVPVAVIRRWHRRGLIVPARQVRRLPYFDFREVATARRLAELLAAGMSPTIIERKLAELGRWLPGVERPLAQLSVIVEGKSLLLRQGDGLIEPGGQLRFDFDGLTTESDDSQPTKLPERDTAPSTPTELLDLAADLEETGDIDQAIEMHRAALAAGGPKPEACFALAELLYRQGDVTAAAERYYMAIELDEDYVEARANLGCVLAELGRLELAASAFEGALALHNEYPDAHYHLARTLDDLGREHEAEAHWHAFLSLASDSPWAATARERLGK